MSSLLGTVKWKLNLAAMVKRCAVWTLVWPVLLSTALFIGAHAVMAQQVPGNANGDTFSLQDGFLNPPASARPRVWWHWMNGNISQEGIKLDLEWMHRVGIAGFQNFDAALSTPQVVKERQAYMTPEW